MRCRWTDLLATFGEATQAHPENVPAWLNLASTLADLGRRDEALAAARQANERAAGSTWASAAATLLNSLQPR